MCKDVAEYTVNDVIKANDRFINNMEKQQEELERSKTMFNELKEKYAELTQHVWVCEPFCENDDALSEPRFNTLWVFDTYSKVDRFINEFMDSLESECGLGPEDIGVDKEENGIFSTVFVTSSELGDVGYFVWFKEVK